MGDRFVMIVPMAVRRSAVVPMGMDMPRRSPAPDRSPVIAAQPMQPSATEPGQKVTFVRRPITSSFLIRWIGSFGLAIPAAGLMTY
jgi:hypothetical protein